MVILISCVVFVSVSIIFVILFKCCMLFVLFGSELNVCRNMVVLINNLFYVIIIV